MVNIITCVFNNFSVVYSSIQSILEKTTIPFKLILVNNHSFDVKTIDYLQKLKKDFSNQVHIQVVDPGRNLGCHGGWNFGFSYRNNQYPFCCKIDDDVVVPRWWAETLTSAFNCWEKSKTPLGMLSADLDCRTPIFGELVSVDNFQYEIPCSAPSFSCVLFKVSVIQQLGLMKGYGLYGHEESHYFNLFRKNNLTSLWLRNIVVHHIDSRVKDWDFIVWKYFYGFRKRTHYDFISFLRSEDFKKAWFSLVEYYLTTERSKLRKDELPEVAVCEFSKRCFEKGWIIPSNLNALIKKFK